MTNSPFPYQGPLEPAEVQGRDDLVAQLITQITDRRVTALLGPRRFGKTSVLRRVAADLSEVATIYVDLFGVQTHADVVLRLSSALQESGAEIRQRAIELSVQAGIDLFGLQLKLANPPSKRPDAKALLEGLLQTIVGLASRRPVLLIMDEFQSAAAVDGAMAMLRTHLQHHYRDIGLIFAGSAPSAMRDIFTRHDQPFFNQADLIEIEPLGLAAVHEIIVAGFAATDRDPGGVSAQIHTFTGGHPQRTMRTADYVWRLCPPDQPADAIWGEAVMGLRHAEAAVMAVMFDELTATEKKVMRIVANAGSIYGAAAERLELSPGAARHARDRLFAEGKLIAGPETTVAVTDPFLADWLRIYLPL